MGETTADTRREIEELRSDLDHTVQRLRARTVVVRGKVVRIGVVAGGAVASLGAVAATVIVVRRSRGGPIVKAARRLPRQAQPAAVPRARGLERWLTKRSNRVEKQREELLENLSARIARQQAQAERKANPLWRRTAARALEAAATVGGGAVINKLMSQRSRRDESASSRKVTWPDTTGPDHGHGAETERTRSQVE